MAISVFSAANYLAKRSGWSWSNLKLQKILYLAQMAYMAEHNGKPLIDDYFEAWDYGPVCPALYHKLKIYGANPVGKILEGYEIPKGKKQERKALDGAYENLGEIPGWRLVAMTHQEHGAWAKYYGSGQHGHIISDKDIQDEYRDVFAK